ncbi:MAG: sigma-70 family RNA polymerase sigma factor [Myxococcales bacterium]|nr:sigma-70 family RNA polymerase sigma factor [Myxococcales bacterium]
MAQSVKSPSTAANCERKGASEEIFLASLGSKNPQERAEAFRQLVNDLERPLFGLCLRILGSRAAAEDALQDVFLTIYCGLPKFRGESSISTWAYRIATRTAMRQRTKANSWTEIDDEATQSTGPTSDDVVESRLVLSTMAKLPAKYHVVLALFAIEGLTHKEIADILGVPEGTVWSRYHSARKSLMERLTSHDEGRG